MKYINWISMLITGGLLLALASGVGTQTAASASPLVKDGTSPVNGPNAPDPKQAIDDFVANADQPIGADEIVSFLTAGDTPAAQTDAFGPAAVFNPAETNMHIAAARLTDDKFVLAYRDVGNANCGTAIVGQVFGTTISWGPETVFNPAVTQYESVAALSDARFVVAYQDGGNSWHGTAIVGTVSGTSISYGSEAVFNPADTEYASVAALSETKFVVAYRDAGDANHGKAVVGQVFGTTINFGSEIAFNPADTAYPSVAALSDTDFVVAYTDLGSSYHGTAIVGQVSGYAITYGSEAVFNPATTYDGSVAALSSSKFVVAYQDGGGSNYGTAVVGQVSGTSIAYGSETVFSAAITKLFHSGGVSGLSDATFVVGYENQGDSDGQVIVGTVSGDAIIFGNQVSYNAGSSSFDVTVVALSASKYVVAWDDESNDDYGTAKVGTVPTLGPAAVFNPAATYAHIAAAKLTDSTFVVAYSDGGNSYHGTAKVGQVSGTAITWGDETVFNAANTEYESVAALSDSKFVVAYKDLGNSYHGTAIVGQVTGTFISYGSEAVFNPVWTEDISVAALSETKFVVAYQDWGNPYYGTAIVGQISSTSISYGSENVFNPADTEYASVAALTDSTFVVAYSDLGNSGYGTARVGQISGTAITWGDKYVFNAARSQHESVAALTDSKFVVAYRDLSGFYHGAAIVGQVSDTSINWGDESVFNSADTYPFHSGAVARLSATAFVVGFENAGDSDGRGIVGTVSGNAITFGHQVSFNAGSYAFDVTVVGLSPKFVVAWSDESNSYYGMAKVGTIPTGGRVYLPLVLGD